LSRWHTHHPLTRQCQFFSIFHAMAECPLWVKSGPQGASA
jgi:hypothetical protein